MRKRVLLLFFLLYCLLGAAKPVSIQKAETVAMTFLGLKPETKGSSPLHLIWTGKQLTKVEEDYPAFYVFKRECGGFIVVSGDDCLHPVLGYSDDFDFKVEDMPANVSWWFSSIAETVSLIRAKGLSQASDVSREWMSVSTKGSEEVILNTALWNQTSPYDRYTPMLRNNGNDHCNIGCTNTATAIVMRYHKHPESGTGTLPDYTYNKGGYVRTQSGHQLGHIYDWKNMPETNLKANSPSYQIEQVARLMYDCAVMNKCKWNPNNSDTDPKNIPYALVTYMGYDKSIRYIERIDYNTDDWERLLRKEIDERRPVLYGGGLEDGNGHEWVVDGYNSNGFFRMNWGWGGSANGYYLISPLSEAGLGFTQRHEMIIGIKPDSGGEPYSSRPPYLTGQSTSNWRFTLNTSFTTVFNIKNESFNECSIRCRVGLTDKNGQLKCYLSDPSTASLAGFQTTAVNHTCVIKEMPDEDDLMMLFIDNDGTWEPMEHSSETVIRMKGPSSIEEGTKVSYSRRASILTITTEKDNAIQIYYTDSGGKYYILMSQQNNGTYSFYTTRVPNPGNGYSPYNLTVHIFNISESKEFRLKLKGNSIIR